MMELKSVGGQKSAVSGEVSESTLGCLKCSTLKLVARYQKELLCCMDSVPAVVESKTTRSPFI